MERKCSACGHVASDAGKYCTACGAPYGAVEDEQPGGAAEPQNKQARASNKKTLTNIAYATAP